MAKKQEIDFLNLKSVNLKQDHVINSANIPYSVLYNSEGVALRQLLGIAKFPAIFHKRMMAIAPDETRNLLEIALKDEAVNILMRLDDNIPYAFLSDSYERFDNDPVLDMVDNFIKDHPQLTKYIWETGDEIHLRIYNKEISVPFGEYNIHPMLMILNSNNGTRGFRVQSGAFFAGFFDLLGRNMFSYVHRGKKLHEGIQDWSASKHREEWLLRELNKRLENFLMEVPSEWVGKMKRLFDEPVSFRPKLAKQFSLKESTTYDMAIHAAKNIYLSNDHLDGSEWIFNTLKYYW